MVELADIFRRYGPEYINRFGSKMLPSHRRALHDIVACRTEQMGGHLYCCENPDGHHVVYAYHSCGNRSCAKCGQDKTQRWIEKQHKSVSTDVWQKDWVVHCKPVGDGNSALKYLAPYIYRVAITNNRIEKLENAQVSFRFKNSDTDQWQTATLPTPEFIHRFLQHVLPKGFVKIRYYGLLSPIKRNLLAVAKYLLGDSRRSDVTPTVVEQHICPHCGAKLRRLKSLPKLTRAPP